MLRNFILRVFHCLTPSGVLVIDLRPKTICRTASAVERHESSLELATNDDMVDSVLSKSRTTHSR